MFYIHYIKKNSWLILLIGLIGIQTSCKKNDSLGAPVIKSLRAISPAPDDSVLTQVTPGQVVVIRGNNFDGARQIFFDGVAASINPALNTNNSMVITVPSGIVFTGLDPDVVNTIQLITDHGQTTFKFSVVPPPPVIHTISNEFAHAGESITLTGSYLYTVQKIIFPGDVAITTGFSNDDAGQSLQATVPNGVTTGAMDSIAVVTLGGTAKAAFHNTYGMIANFEDGDPHFGWLYWGGIKSNDATAFPNGWGNYIEIKPGSPINAGDNSWWANNRAVMIDSSTWQGIALSDSPDSVDLKFQLYVKKPWSNGSLSIVIDGDFEYMADYAPWKQASNGQFITNGWITVSIPFSDFKNGDGESANSVGDLTNGVPGNQVQIMLYNNGTTTLTDFDAAFDNVRVVKVK